MKVKKRGKAKGGGEAFCSQIPGVLKGRLMTCTTACPLGDRERLPTLPLPLSDDASQLAAGISLPTKLPDTLTKAAFEIACRHIACYILHQYVPHTPTKGTFEYALASRQSTVT